MRGRKTTSGLAAIAVGGALVLGGCGGGSGTTDSSNASAPAGAAMKGKHDDMKAEHDAMKGDDAMKGQGHAMPGDEEAMHGEKAMHEKNAGHGEAMREG
jgi:hypothetical protein